MEYLSLSYPDCKIGNMGGLRISPGNKGALNDSNYCNKVKQEGLLFSPMAFVIPY
jgi:hypothetical protein